ncbi:MAG TPA: SAM-dependent methyltransferase [Planctomycetaceae bacterium]|nr:SAM-dependent methyltransferase [Planctomycetaceae bacterium]
MRFAALAARAKRRFPWHWQPVTVAGRSIEIATPTDPNELLIQACQRQESSTTGEDETTLADPFWAQVWRSTAGLDAFLANRDLRGVDVLELGCGTGVAGIAAALRGARVTFTDGATDPLLLLSLTLQRNRIARCGVRRLIFGNDVLPGKRFPLIIASDITYLQKCWPGLLQTLHSHLGVGGEVLLGDPYRSTSTEFIVWASQRRWTVQEHRTELSDTPIRVIRMTTA